MGSNAVKLLIKLSAAVATLCVIGCGSSAPTSDASTAATTPTPAKAGGPAAGAGKGMINPNVNVDGKIGSAGK
jgi:hypothetical protein